MKKSPMETPFSVNCVIEQTDFFQYDFLEAYWEMNENRRYAGRNCIIAAAAAVLFTLLVLLVPAINNNYMIVSLGLPAFSLLIYGYTYLWGYKSDYKQLQKLLAGAIEKDNTIYTPVSQRVDFGVDDVSVVDVDTTETRLFYYTDIKYFEQTDRFYVIGLRYSRTETRLKDLNKVLITKRHLNANQREKIDNFIEAATQMYKLEPILQTHPFRPTDDRS